MKLVNKVAVITGGNSGIGLAAVRSLARSMSVGLLPRGTRVNVLSPGMTDTPIISREGGPPGATPEQIAAMITRTIPLRRRGTAEEMAKAMLLLASDDSSYCLGSELLVDGWLSELVNPDLRTIGRSASW